MSAGWHYPFGTRALLTIYHTANLLTLVSLLLYCIHPSPLLIVPYGLKVSSDLLLFAAGESHIRRFPDWKWYLPLEFLYVLYVSSIGPLSRVLGVSWKGSASL